MLEDPDFVENNTRGFTQVMHRYGELVNSTARIVELSNGKVSFDRSFNASLLQPVLQSLSRFVRKTG